jgi:A/G-specific adenine glycosylase
MGARARRGAAGGGTALKARRALIGWYRANRRDLPWRRTRDPWAVWVSEAMLQQTRALTVIPYYERFLRRFPDPASLARADLDDVLGLWAGLGYYSRARNLRAAAAQVVECFGGSVPDTVEQLQTLPGVGRYTAGAVASIAFDRPAPVVDGNVARVLSRLRGIREAVDGAAGRARLWTEAEALASGPAPGDLNQALMELGARVCLPRAPRCPICPVARHCAARAAGDAESLPRRAPRRKPRAVHAVAALVLRRGRALAVRRPPRGLFGGLWQLPGAEVASARTADAVTLARVVRERTGLEIGAVEPAGRLEHGLTHRTLRLRVFRCEAKPGRVRLSGWDRHRWVTPQAFAGFPLGALDRRALTLASGLEQEDRS